MSPILQSLARIASLSLLVIAAISCRGSASDTPAARSLLGLELSPRPLTAEFEAEQIALLKAATLEAEEDPENVEARIWQARRLGYLGRYDEAIATLTDAMALAPEDPRLYRHRGHRFLTLRRLDAAVSDFSLAHDLTAGTPDRVEPDGLPNAAGVPTSTLKTNIAYHRGLAWLCLGEWERARGEYARGFSLAENFEQHAGRTAGTTFAAEFFDDTPAFLTEESDDDLTVRIRGIVVRYLSNPSRLRIGHGFRQSVRCLGCQALQRAHYTLTSRRTA